MLKIARIERAKLVLKLAKEGRTNREIGEAIKEKYKTPFDRWQIRDIVKREEEK